MQKQMPKIEVNNPWLKDLSDQGREQVERELAKQQNALKRMIGRDRPLDTLLVALKDEYKFDLDAAMVQANKEFEEAQRKGA